MTLSTIAILYYYRTREGELTNCQHISSCGNGIVKREATKPTMLIENLWCCRIYRLSGHIMVKHWLN